MDIDLDRCTGLSKLAMKELGYGTICASTDCMKDLLKCKKLGKRVLIGEDEILIYPKE